MGLHFFFCNPEKPDTLENLITFIGEQPVKGFLLGIPLPNLMTRKFFLTLFGSLLILFAHSQAISISGQVVDKESGEGIPFVSIGLIDANRGTSTNENGLFILRLDSLPQGIIFAHLNYERRAIRVENDQNIVVELQPTTRDLEAITVKGKKRQGYVENLVMRAYEKTLSSSRKNQYAKAFYRQKSQNDTLYSELYEVFYDLRSSSVGILDWEIQEGRYALNVDDHMVVNKNFTLLSRIMTPIQPDTEDFIMPTRPDVKNFYEYEILKVLDIDDRKVAVINFVPDKDLITPAWKGEVYIDINSYDILKLSGGFEDDRLKFIKLAKEGLWKNYKLNYEISFRSGDEGNMSIDYVQVEQFFDYYQDDVFRFPVETHSILTVYEQYNPVKKKRLGGRIRYRKSDAFVLDQLGYDRLFWEENPILKRTPVEEEVIAAFESRKAFGTIYLNDQKQIILEQNNLLKDKFMKGLVADYENLYLPQEKVYLHLDKPFYAAGESLWYSAFLVDAATHFDNTLSNSIHVELINPYKQVVDHRIIAMDQGHGVGDIKLAEDLEAGKYWIRAYTQWMRNFDENFYFTKEIPIVSRSNPPKKPNRKPDSTISVKFFPEGGDLIDGIASQIGIKAIGLDGKGIKIKGTVFDELGKTLARFESNEMGMGSFYMMPKVDMNYEARVVFNDLEYAFSLPEVLDDGIAIQVNNRPNTLKVIVQSTEEFNESSFYLIGQSRGRIIHKSKNTLERRKALVEIPKNRIPEGIFQITLFDDKGNPRCERLVFINDERQIDLKIEKRKPGIHAREKIALDIDLRDPEGYQVEGTFSVAITDANQVYKNPSQGHLQSYLLLSSDLMGHIEQPGYYFQEANKITFRDLDQLMLTQGWRRFTWQQVQNKTKRRTKFYPEKGFTLEGLAVDPATRIPMKNVSLMAVAMADSASSVVSVRTTEMGTFSLHDLKYSDTSRVYFNIPGVKNQAKAIEVSLHIPDSPSRYFKRSGNSFTTLMAEQNMIAYLDKDAERRLVAKARAEKVQLLDGVTVTGDRPVSFGVDAVIRPDEKMVFTDIVQMMSGRVPGVVVSGYGTTAQIRIRQSSGPPLIVLDGFPLYGGAFQDLRQLGGGQVGNNGGGQGAVTANGATGGGFGVATVVGGNDMKGIKALLSIPPDQVDRIEILKGASASRYGVFGGNGVIEVYTKKGTILPDNTISKNLSFVEVPGFYAHRTFYSPDYEVVDDDELNPDKRVTLYWNPSVKTDKTGKAHLTFYNSDIARDLQVDLQGISKYGVPFNTLLTIKADEGLE